MIFSSQFGVIVFLGYIAMAIVHTAIYSKRLNTRGELLKEDWLGFKMYLETAERYRMQNLTPEIFEKYLPYAMIFGIEKKWAKAFDGINMQSPTWYSGAVIANSNNFSSGATPSFSASSFASGFSSSFASSFASSGGGGGAS